MNSRMRAITHHRATAVRVSAILAGEGFGDPMKITHGKRAAICVAWNMGKTVEEIAQYHRARKSHVQRFLETRRGYPGRPVENVPC